MAPIDLTGQRFGRLLAISRRGSNWACVCDCGQEKEVKTNALTGGRTLSCGCLASEVARGKGHARLVDISGQRFGRLTVTERAPNRYGKKTAWRCTCDCGEVVEVSGVSLTTGNTSSCGCLRRNDHPVITYEAAHLRVRQAKGVASSGRCVDCGQPAAQWSYDHSDAGAIICARRGSAYSLDVARYVPRCPSCHKTHDNQIARSA